MGYFTDLFFIKSTFCVRNWICYFDAQLLVFGLITPDKRSLPCLNLNFNVWSNLLMNSDLYCSNCHILLKHFYTNSPQITTVPGGSQTLWRRSRMVFKQTLQMLSYSSVQYTVVMFLDKISRTEFSMDI